MNFEELAPNPMKLGKMPPTTMLSALTMERCADRRPEPRVPSRRPLDKELLLTMPDELLLAIEKFGPHGKSVIFRWPVENHRLATCPTTRCSKLAL